MQVSKEDQEGWLMVCFKYLLFVFNFLFWVGGVAVLGVGVWTLVEKSDYLSLLASSTFAASACILVVAGSLVVVTGYLGCCAVIREQRSCLSLYFFCLLLIFTIELVAGVLAYVYYQRVSEELKQHLNLTMTENYAQPGKEDITVAVDRLQQDFKCCGSSNSGDWLRSRFVTSAQAEGRVVPDSCCKTSTPLCGRRDHPSNIYKVEGGCISKLERFLADHLLVIGAVGIGVASLQDAAENKLARMALCLFNADVALAPSIHQLKQMNILEAFFAVWCAIIDLHGVLMVLKESHWRGIVICGMVFTSCLYRRIKMETY